MWSEAWVDVLPLLWVHDATCIDLMLCVCARQARLVWVVNLRAVPEQQLRYSVVAKARRNVQGRFPVLRWPETQGEGAEAGASRQDVKRYSQNEGRIAVGLCVACDQALQYIPCWVRRPPPRHREELSRLQDGR